MATQRARRLGGMDEVRRVVEWFVARFRMQDWQIGALVGDEVPEWGSGVKAAARALGMSTWWEERKEGRLWVGPSRHGPDESELETLMHELGHLALADAGLPSEDGRRPLLQHFLDRLSSVMAAAYEAEVGRGGRQARRRSKGARR